MGKRTGVFTHESVEDPQSVVAYLSALSDGFCSGKLLFSSGKKQLTMTPDSLLRLVVKASSKGDASKVTLRISWKNHPRPTDNPPSLIIEATDGDEDE